MDISLIIISSIVFLSVYLIVVFSNEIIFKDRIELEKRLKTLNSYGTKKRVLEDEELQKSFVDRIVKPILNKTASLTGRFSKNENALLLEKKLILAGNPFGLNAKEFGSLYLTTGIFFGVIIFALAEATKQGLFMSIVGFIWGVILGRVFVDMFLKMSISTRRQLISRNLPDVLDLLTISVEAGLGFDSALQKVVNRTKGPVAYEFGKTLQEIKMGKQRKDALKDLGNRTGVEELNALISAIIQVDQLGVSIGNVLRSQSKQMRLLQKQRIEEKAMKAPIKMLLPMVFFIFPTIFLVLLGPAVIQMMSAMK